MSDSNKTAVHQVHLWPIEKTIEVQEGETLLKACMRNGVSIKSSCGGVASCAQCVCRIKSGEDNLNDMKFEEIKLLGNVFHITKERLSCQLKVHGDMTLDISDHIGAITSKSAAPTKTLRRKKEEAEAIITERIERSKQKRLEKAAKPQALGGKRKPKRFDYSEES